MATQNTGVKRTFRLRPEVEKELDQYAHDWELGKKNIADIIAHAEKAEPNMITLFKELIKIKFLNKITYLYIIFLLNRSYFNIFIY